MLHIHKLSNTTSSSTISLTSSTSKCKKAILKYFPNMTTIDFVNNFGVMSGVSDYPSFRIGFTTNGQYDATVVVDDTPGEEKIILIGSSVAGGGRGYQYNVVGLTEGHENELFTNNMYYPLNNCSCTLNIPYWAPSPGIYVPDEIRFLPLIGVAADETKPANAARMYKNIAVSTNYVTAPSGVVYDAVGDDPEYKWVSVGGHLFVRCKEYELINDY